MKIILTIIMMNGVLVNYEYKVDKYNPYFCDAAFKKLTYSGKVRGKKSTQMGTFYKSKEVFAYTCSIA
jgi:hypothetical protein